MAPVGRNPFRGAEELEPITIARRIVDTASDKQASDILLLDISGVSSLADCMIIMSADNVRQMNTLAEEIAMTMKEGGVTLHHREGTAESGWVLLDFADVIVHVFTVEMRDYYRLDQVWSRAKTLVRIQ